MSKIDHFGETQNVAITVLVDNRADLIVESTESVKYFTDAPLLAEHGFAAFIELQEVNVRILWDAGITRISLLENARQMGIDLSRIDKIALSHGHGDHTAAITDILQVIGRRYKPRRWDKNVTADEIETWLADQRVPIIAHPAAFRERWGIRKDGSRFGPSKPPSCAAWEAAGAQVILSEGPHQLGPGCWTTGNIPRLSFEKAGTPAGAHFRDGASFKRDQIEDDQAIVIHVEDKGLIIVAGCAHAGIVNTLNHARQISGVDRVWAILGGFHLARADDEQIQRTIDAVKDTAPAVVAPSHCTGFKAISQFAIQMPDEFVLGAVGTKYLF
jgi:7,8-dihydropterin-6-yl-methyl-4-(beta-D-ribofuranosyl)aminobenzene 5'-phosphate synthase